MNFLRKNNPFYLSEQSEMVEFLIKNGANVNAEHDAGRSPLHLASRNGIIRLRIKFN